MMSKTTSQRRMIVADCLETIRTNVGLTHQEIAERIGTSEIRIGEWESGKRQIDLVELNVFCRAIGVPMSRFIDELEGALSAGKASE